mmetsp:Transcript_21377/g.70675  ORF Transcript_21377/g.70675 Transcript_21377/m.70675 type:complete len:233 (+) Transcript_21377:259-957(+)
MPRAKRKKLRRTQTLRALWLAAALAHPVPSLRCCLRGAEYPLSIPQAARLRTLPLSPASLGLRAGRGDTSARLHACAGLRDGGATHKRWVPPPLSPGLLLVRLSPPLQGAPDTRARPLMAAECLSPVLGLLVRRLVRKVNRPLPALLGVLGGVHVHLLELAKRGAEEDNRRDVVHHARPVQREIDHLLRCSSAGPALPLLLALTPQQRGGGRVGDAVPDTVRGQDNAPPHGR